MVPTASNRDKIHLDSEPTVRGAMDFFFYDYMHGRFAFPMYLFQEKIIGGKGKEGLGLYETSITIDSNDIKNAKSAWASYQTIE